MAYFLDLGMSLYLYQKKFINLYFSEEKKMNPRKKAKDQKRMLKQTVKDHVASFNSFD